MRKILDNKNNLMDYLGEQSSLEKELKEAKEELDKALKVQNTLSTSKEALLIRANVFLEKNVLPFMLEKEDHIPKKFELPKEPKKEHLYTTQINGEEVDLVELGLCRSLHI